MLLRRIQFISIIQHFPNSKKKNQMISVQLNLKPLNQFVEKIHFRIENIQMAFNAINQGELIISLNLKDAYLSISIFHPNRKYLRCLWQSKLCEFTCLPFGYSLAPRVFTKVLKPVMVHLRFRGMKITFSFDDILLAASSRHRDCTDQVAIMIQL